MNRLIGFQGCLVVSFAAANTAILAAPSKGLKSIQIDDPPATTAAAGTKS